MYKSCKTEVLFGCINLVSGSVCLLC
jgi:hypothetical protein